MRDLTFTDFGIPTESRTNASQILKDDCIEFTKQRILTSMRKGMPETSGKYHPASECAHQLVTQLTGMQHIPQLVHF